MAVRKPYREIQGDYMWSAPVLRAEQHEEFIDSDPMLIQFSGGWEEIPCVQCRSCGASVIDTASSRAVHLRDRCYAREVHEDPDDPDLWGCLPPARRVVTVELPKEDVQ